MQEMESDGQKQEDTEGRGFRENMKDGKMWKEAKGIKGTRCRAGIANESSLLFFQLFFYHKQCCIQGQKLRKC